MTVFGDDFYWTNQVSSDFTNVNNWVTNGLGVTVPPGIGDNVFFTNADFGINWQVNVTNANVNVNSTGGIITQAMGSSTWYVTNSYVIGQTAEQTGTVRFTSGILAITNAGRTGTLVVGQSGGGNLVLTGGTLIVDRLIVTNNPASMTNSVFNFSSGTLTTRSNSVINVPISLGIGATAGQTAIWNIEGGVVTITETGSGFGVILGNGSSTVIVNVIGVGTIWSNNVTLFVGNTSASSTLVVSNGGAVRSAAAMIGNGSNKNRALVTDFGSVWNSGALTIGSGSANALVVSNGGVVNGAGTTVGSTSSSANNTNIVTGTGSALKHAASTYTLGSLGSIKNFLLITNGGIVVDSTATIGANTGSSVNVAIVAGSGSFWSNNANLVVGYAGRTNQLIIDSGGGVKNLTGYVGYSSLATNSLATVSGVGSTWSNIISLVVGATGINSQLMITNGGFVFGTNVTLGLAAGGSGAILVTGSNSTLKAVGALNVGSNALSLGQGSVLLLDNGILETTNMNSGYSGTGTISNRGGVFQFVNAAPVVTTNDVNSIVITNGILSYRDVTAADIYNPQISNITFQGENTFRLNNSTNVSVSTYVFGTNNGNLYQHLNLLNGVTRWQSTTFTMGSGGILSISNTTATVAGLFTNAGTVNVFGSRVTYESPVFIHGAYLSDPSTNIFSTNVTVGSSGYIQAAAGDVYQFERNLTIQSTQSNLFNMSGAIALFTNLGGAHILDLTGSSALDRGTNGIITLNDVTNNFAFGLLQVAGPGDTLRVTGAVANALYVGTLDLGVLGNTNNLFTDVNVYYDANLAANAYLGKLTYDLQGAGMLIPYGVPEPTGIFLLGMGILLWRKRGMFRPAC